MYINNLKNNLIKENKATTLFFEEIHSLYSGINILFFIEFKIILTSRSRFTFKFF